MNERETHGLILNLLKDGKISINQARTLSGLKPINDPCLDELIKKV